LLELALNVSQLINQSIFIYRIENQKIWQSEQIKNSIEKS
jgi:hypothetical protein